ncbi:MAG TPA: DNA alkylation repair protein [Candidatus Nanopelagicales bacterium]
MTGPDRALVDDVRAALAAVADPERAVAMQSYMKSAMPFRGAPKPVQVAALRPVLAAHPVTDRATWDATIRELYDGATFREERYAALAVLDLRAARAWRDPDLVRLLEHLVVTGAWWDLVDVVAGRQVAPLHRAFPAEMASVVRRWAEHDDLWLRRTAILSQLGSGLATDHALLTDVIEANAASREFFHRKAIGWALRDLAWKDPEWVRTFVQMHPDLSPLSRREALKNL